MGTVHKFIGDGENKFDWAGQRFFEYGESAGVYAGATVRWLIGAAEKAPNFALRYYEIPPGQTSAAEQHPYEHGVMIVRGQAIARLGKETVEVGPHDVVYIEPNEFHQFINADDKEIMGFLCIIPAHRLKNSGKQVYAESDLFPEYQL